MTEELILDTPVLPKQAVSKLLKGQKALVTGANSGIGKAVAIALGEAGADVVVNYVRGDDTAHEVVNTISQFGSHAIALQADVSQEAQVQEMFRRMFDEFGTIDILVNNAGLQQDSAFEKMTLQQWNTVNRHQPDWAIPLCQGGSPRVQTARYPTRRFRGSRKDHLHEFST